MLQGNLAEVFLDTDVAFDIISKRDPHYDSSVRFLQLATKGTIQLVISGSCLANLIYLTFDIYKIPDAVPNLTDFIGSCKILSTDKLAALNALQSEFKDKEDALQYYTALHADVDYLITRNIKDYKHQVASLPVCTPDEFFKLFI